MEKAQGDLILQVGKVTEPCQVSLNMQQKSRYVGIINAEKNSRLVNDIRYWQAQKKKKIKLSSMTYFPSN